MKVLALDIGNVCVAIDPGNFLRALGLTELTPPQKNLLRQLEWGGIGEEEFFRLSARYLKPDQTVFQLRAAFDSIIIKPVPGMTELVLELPSLGWEAHFFSDISTAHWRRTRELFPAWKAVDGGIFSYAVGAWKPDEKMFRAFEEKYGQPDLYVDDRENLISAAADRGWTARRFVSAEKLKQLLQTI